MKDRRIPDQAILINAIPPREAKGIRPMFPAVAPRPVVDDS